MNHLVKEALVHVDRDELEEVLVKQGEHLVPHVLLQVNNVISGQKKNVVRSAMFTCISSGSTT